jgi:hypothetical protein
MCHPESRERRRQYCHWLWSRTSRAPGDCLFRPGRHQGHQESQARSARRRHRLVPAPPIPREPPSCCSTGDNDRAGIGFDGQVFEKLRKADMTRLEKVIEHPIPETFGFASSRSCWRAASSAISFSRRMRSSAMGPAVHWIGCSRQICWNSSKLLSRALSTSSQNFWFASTCSERYFSQAASIESSMSWLSLTYSSFAFLAASLRSFRYFWKGLSWPSRPMISFCCCPSTRSATGDKDGEPIGLRVSRAINSARSDAVVHRVMRSRVSTIPALM